MNNFPDDSYGLAELTRRLKLQSPIKEPPVTLLDHVMVVLGGLLFFTVMALPLIIYFIWAYAVVTKIFWAWFVVPVFGLPELGIAQAVGLTMLINLWVPQSSNNQNTNNPNEAKSAKLMQFLAYLAKPWCTLLIGWICHRYFL
jgi:hypothetical protein